MEHFLLPAAGLVKSHRPQQVEFARIVENVLATGGIAVVQARTGTGKTIGYGVPVFTGGKKVIVSTAKKGLQTQIFEKDFPILKEKVSPKEFEYLKGRSNNVCKARYQTFKENANAWDRKALERIDGRVEAGEVDLDALDVPFRGSIGVTECIKALCKYNESCGYLAARGRFWDAPIRIANHAMVAMEAVMGRGILLGEYEALILDEAHLFPGFVRGAYSFEYNSELPERLERIYDGVYGLGFNNEMKGLSRELFTEISYLNEGAFDPKAPVIKNRLRDITDVIDGMREDLWPYVSQFMSIETLMADPGKAIAAAHKVEDVSELIRAIYATNELTKASDALNRICGRNPYARRIERMVESGLMDQAAAAEILQLREDNELEYVSHVTKGVGPQLKLEPVDVGPVIRAFFKDIPTVVLTSATLCSGGSFGFTLYSFGLGEKDVKVLKDLPTAFEYSKQAMLYVEDELPGYPKFTEGLDVKMKYFQSHADRIHELCTSSGGGAFVLVPAWDDVYKYKDLLVSRTKNYKLMVQSRGDSISRLVANFESRMDNVLIATKSLWEGVDIPGAALRLVIVTRMPFIAESNAVYARQKANYASKLMDEDSTGKITSKEAEFKAFLRLSVQQACVELDQGLGRLIRSNTDRGGMAILDSRMGLKSRTNYKAMIYKTFPMKPTNDRALFNEYLGIIKPKGL